MASKSNLLSAIVVTFGNALSSPCLKVATAVLGSESLTESMFLYPVLSYVSSRLATVCHVNLKSVDVMGWPSDHLAAELILYVTFWTGLVSSVGSPARRSVVTC